jgi:hypothetical protein
MELITFEENFTDNKNGWYLIKDDIAELEIANDSYLMNHKKDEGSYSTWRTFHTIETKSFCFEIKVKTIESSDTGEFGIIWGLSIDSSNNWNYSIFTIKNDKFYIGTYDHHVGEFKALNPWVFSPTIKIGNDSVNTLKIMRFDDQIDKQLYFFINDKMVFQNKLFPYVWQSGRLYFISKDCHCNRLF